MSWNPVLNMFVEIKKAYGDKFGDINYDEVEIVDKHTKGKKIATCVENWAHRLNIDKYNKFVKALQFNQFENLLLMRYGKTGLDELVGMWENQDSIYRECRSLVLNIKTDEIALCPYRKFFNMNEVEENSMELLHEEIKNGTNVEITNKLDGSMQSARWYNGQVLMSGSMALDRNESWRLKDGYSMVTDNHTKMFEENKDWTFIFEYIGAKNRHVVDYSESMGLYLIGARNVVTGEEMCYNGINNYSIHYNVPATTIERITFDEVLEQMKVLKADIKEGWVINIDGHRVKVKCDDYVGLHRVLDKLGSVNVIIESIANDCYDDVVSKIPKKFRKRADVISSLVFNYRDEIINNVKSLYTTADKTDKKTFMVWVNNNVDKELQGYIRSEYYGTEWNVLKNNAGKYRKFNDMFDKTLEEYLGETQ